MEAFKYDNVLGSKPARGSHINPAKPRAAAAIPTPRLGWSGGRRLVLVQDLYINKLGLKNHVFTSDRQS
jgi:hypothetical protein